MPHHNGQPQRRTSMLWRRLARSFWLIVMVETVGNVLSMEASWLAH
jgi:hypothetical protein